MASLPDVDDDITDVEVQFQASLSELLFERLGGAINFLRKRSSNFLSFTANNTWTVPAGVSQVLVQGCGGGGGGRGGIGGGNPPAGGNGALYYARVVSVTPAANISITIGAGGAGATINLPGSNGGASSFGALATFPGARGGGVQNTTQQSFPSLDEIFGGGNADMFFGVTGIDFDITVPKNGQDAYGFTGGAANTSGFGSCGGAAGPFGNGGAGGLSGGSGGTSAAANSGAGGGGGYPSNSNPERNGGNGGSGRIDIFWVGNAT